MAAGLVAAAASLGPSIACALDAAGGSGDPTGADAGAHDRAVGCLAAAIYYEAANQPLEGRQGVAQVVLNRLRHPAFPKSVCAVVFQGAPRRGCQFTFACDGSMDRPPARPAGRTPRWWRNRP